MKKGEIKKGELAPPFLIYEFLLAAVSPDHANGDKP